MAACSTTDESAEDDDVVADAAKSDGVTAPGGFYRIDRATLPAPDALHIVELDLRGDRTFYRTAGPLDEDWGLVIRTHRR